MRYLIFQYFMKTIKRNKKVSALRKTGGASVTYLNCVNEGK